jgi:hypothetical protein
VINDVENTVPTLPMRQGNFSQLPLIPGGVDPNNNNAPIFANTIYNPNSNYTLNGVTEGVPFEGNIVPQSSHLYDTESLREQKG